MVSLQYFNGQEWVNCGQYGKEELAWISLGSDNENYRTVDESGNVLTDKSTEAFKAYVKRREHEITYAMLDFSEIGMARTGGINAVNKEDI